MKFSCSYSELVEPHKLIPHPKNPNDHPANQIEALAKIIDYQGQRSPIVVSKKSGFIIVGHGRLMAMKKLGWEKVAVDYQEFESEAQEYAHLTADNAMGEWSELDLSQINNDFVDFGPELDIEMLGLKDFTIEPLIVDLPDIGSGDKDLQQMTFTLSNDQVDQVKRAIEKAKGLGPLEDELNQNKNGNALARVAELFISEC